MAQAKSAKFTLLKKCIRERLGIARGQYAHAVCSPDFDAPKKTAASGKSLGLDLDGGVLINGSAMDEIGKRVTALVYGGTAEEFSRSDLDAIAKMFEPSWELGGALGLQGGRSSDEVARLTDIQHQTRRGLLSNPRAVVYGCAGSGKSILVLRRAGEMATAGKSALYVCFNRLLADHQRAVVATSVGRPHTTAEAPITAAASRAR